MARILILGGGYGGLRAALRLDSLLGRNRRDEITLIDQNEYHQLIVRLHEVAAGSINCPDVLVPFERVLHGKNVRFERAIIKGISLPQREVETTAGNFSYDKLVIALGSETNFFNIPGLKEQSFELKSYRDACRLANHVEHLFVAARDEPDPAKRREILTILVGGGGFTGAELAGEFADYRDDLADKYGLSRHEARILIVESKEVLLGGFDAILAEKAARTLERKGVDLLLGRGLKSVQEGNIGLTTGQSFRASTLVWTGGIKASRLISTLGIETGASGRAVLNPYSELADHPSVYVVGDCALILDPQSGRPIAPSAQVALQQGTLVAYNINAEIRDRPRRRFDPRIVAEMVSLGRYDAIGLIGPFRMSGLIPSMLKRAAAYRYLLSIGGTGLLIEKLGLGTQTFTELARAIRHSSNRKVDK